MNILEIKKFFFEASLAGWAGNGKKTTLPELPMLKVYIYEKGRFRYVDLYYAYASGKQSFGQTTIWYDGIPVWGMQFGGYYPEDVIPFLKTALRNTYSHVTTRNQKVLLRQKQEDFLIRRPVESNHAPWNGAVRVSTGGQYRLATTSRTPASQSYQALNKKQHPLTVKGCCSGRFIRPQSLTALITD